MPHGFRPPHPSSGENLYAADCPFAHVSICTFPSFPPIRTRPGDAPSSFFVFSSSVFKLHSRQRFFLTFNLFCHPFGPTEPISISGDWSLLNKLSSADHCPSFFPRNSPPDPQKKKLSTFSSSLSLLLPSSGKSSLIFWYSRFFPSSLFSVASSVTFARECSMAHAVLSVQVRFLPPPPMRTKLSAFFAAFGLRTLIVLSFLGNLVVFRSGVSYCQCVPPLFSPHESELLFPLPHVPFPPSLSAGRNNFPSVPSPFQLPRFPLVVLR